jgi:monoamine oxidase
MNEVIIAGAGLSGLTAAYQLNKSGIPACILEARDRTGGRINTLAGPVEMGATWFGNQHVHLKRLIEKLTVNAFEQFTQGRISYDIHSEAAVQYMEMPANQPPSFRITGGSGELINSLVNELNWTDIYLNTTIKTITDQGDHLMIEDSQGKVYTSRLAIVTLPPQLLIEKVSFSPQLPSDIGRLMATTHTWMGASIKFAISYSAPFWKSKGFSGMGFAQAGPIEEIHDHTNAEEDFFALKGFLRPALHQLTGKEREELVKAQVIKLFGVEAGDYLQYYDKPWINESFTSVKEATPLMPHENNGHPMLALPLLNGKVFLAGTESSPVYGGYMEGAVFAGLRAAEQVAKALTGIQSS